jgi:hypothetical protein
MDRKQLARSAHDGFMEEDFYNLCFWGDNNMTIEEIAKEAYIRHGQVRVSTIGKLRALGHEPFRSDPWPHLTVMFEWQPTDDQIEELVGAFDPPVQNPDPKE